MMAEDFYGELPVQVGMSVAESMQTEGDWDTSASAKDLAETYRLRVSGS